MSYKGSYLISKCELIPNGSSLEENYDIARGNHQLIIMKVSQVHRYP